MRGDVLYSTQSVYLYSSGIGEISFMLKFYAPVYRYSFRTFSFLTFLAGKGTTMVFRIF